LEGKTSQIYSKCRNDFINIIYIFKYVKLFAVINAVPAMIVIQGRF